MTPKLWLARVAAVLERGIERFRGPRTGPARFEPYVGYATPDHLVIRGRMLTNAAAEPARPNQSRLSNFRAMVGLFRTDELPGVAVQANGVGATSDEEGYVRMQVPRADATGRVAIPVTYDGQTTDCPVVIPADTASFGIISDIDDTMILTGAYSLRKNLWTSLTGNAATRLVFPDAVRLMGRLNAGENPVFFVSSSPWNFYGFLRAVMLPAGLPDAPMFLRDYGISETQFITGTHGDHKSAAIDTILAANPDLPFVLIGDTGQHDAQVYANVADRHPGRITRVILREAGADRDQAAIDRLSAAKIPVSIAENYDKMDI